MHATRARLPQKRSRSRKPSAKQAAPHEASALIQASHPGVVSLSSRRAEQRQPAAAPVEIYALVEWIGPARDSWRRGELEVRRSACMPMAATRQPDGTIALGDLPGQGDLVLLEPADLAALASGAAAAIVRMLPGMRVTLTAEDLAPTLPVARNPGEVLAFRPRSRVNRSGT